VTLRMQARTHADSLQLSLGSIAKARGADETRKSVAEALEIYGPEHAQEFGEIPCIVWLAGMLLVPSLISPGQTKISVAASAPKTPPRTDLERLAYRLLAALSAAPDSTDCATRVAEIVRSFATQIEDALASRYSELHGHRLQSGQAIRSAVLLKQTNLELHSLKEEFDRVRATRFWRLRERIAKLSRARK